MGREELVRKIEKGPEDRCAIDTGRKETLKWKRVMTIKIEKAKDCEQVWQDGGWTQGTRVDGSPW